MTPKTIIPFRKEPPSVQSFFGNLRMSSSLHPVVTFRTHLTNVFNYCFHDCIPLSYVDSPLSPIKDGRKRDCAIVSFLSSEPISAWSPALEIAIKDTNLIRPRVYEEKSSGEAMSISALRLIKGFLKRRITSPLDFSNAFILAKC
jgi:hypothetical protein